MKLLGDFLMNKNDILRLEVEDMNNLGNGIAHVDGFAVFVVGGVTGDIITGKIIKVTKSYAVARIEDLITSSPFRTESRSCPFDRKCGGCMYRNISREYELEIKRDTVASALRREGLKDISVSAVVTDGVCDRYRNKAQYPFSPLPGGKIASGFYSPKSHNVVDISDCLLLPECFSRIMNSFREYMECNHLTAYDEKSCTGLVRHLFLRSNSKGEVYACIVINGDEIPDENKLVCFLRDSYHEISGIAININKSCSNVILGKRFRTVFGPDYLEDTICGLNIRISPGAFYQVNHDAAQMLYSIAADTAVIGSNDTVLDLFCGTGVIGLSMAAKCRRVVGVDIVESAIENARHNAKINNINNASFIVSNADQGSAMFKTITDKEAIDFSSSSVIIDPPRKGCSRDLLDTLSELPVKKILYISCNPNTLARDLVILVSHGFSVRSITPVDMFPNTGHVESVVKLIRQ